MLSDRSITPDIVISAGPLRIAVEAKMRSRRNLRAVRPRKAKRFGGGASRIQWFNLPHGVTDDVVERWFAQLGDEAIESGEVLPEQSTLDEAKRIVRGIQELLPGNTDVYAFDEGKVAIELYGRVGHGFLLVCEPGEKALCIVTVAGVPRRARYESSATLPDGFVREGLEAVLHIHIGREALMKGLTAPSPDIRASLRPSHYYG